MAELVPLPLSVLLKRAFLEHEREGKIFDLPQAKFFRGFADLDTSVRFHGYRASTPVGPAAGPHDQLLQNIVLSWLAGSRIIELKTVQVLDALNVPRPCIDMTNVGYNVEWSQELKLEQSLREYVGASMFIEILKAARLLGEDFDYRATETIYDMSVGYSLEGIRSPRVRAWIEAMKDATGVVNELRAGLTGAFAPYRDLPFPARVSDTITLSTFHGCPAHEIEGIVSFLLAEMDVHVCIKLNPTLLGKEAVGHLLHDVMGYREILVTPDAFEKDLQFADVLEMIPRLDRLARSRGKRLAVKFSNTLVVKNHKTFFSDEVMYMSGPPLHVLTMNLVKKFREHMGARIPISFSAGIDARNFANAVAMSFVPVTTCTDLLRPGGYGRLIRYLANLGAKMREMGVARIPDFVVRYAGQAEAAIKQVTQEISEALRQDFAGADSRALASAESWLRGSAAARFTAWLGTPGERLDAACGEIARDFEQRVADSLPAPLAASLRAALGGLEQSLVDAAGVLNTPCLVEQATADPRYWWERNHAVPRKIGSKLWFYDCINCDKCVPDCPNDANFAYEVPETQIRYDNYDLVPGGAARPVPGGIFKVAKSRQLANYADACNECGNCDVFCPEDGGPYIEKPRLFGSIESYRKHAGRNGFFIAYEGGRRTVYATVAGKAYILALDPAADRAWFDDGSAEIEMQLSKNAVLSWKQKPGTLAGGRAFDMLPYLQLKMMADAISDPRHVHYANVAGL
jgi:putative selenate reductase